VASDIIMAKVLAVSRATLHRHLVESVCEEL
jgi:hypothetical protein